MSKPRTKTTTAGKDDLSKIIQDYIIATGADEIDMNEVARWAIAEGKWTPPPYNPRKACAQQLSRAAREEYYTDPQEREVRKRHCYVFVEPGGQKCWHWVDIQTAKPDAMHKSFQARRRQALGDVSQCNLDLLSFNDNNKYGAKLEMSFNFDADLAEMSQPTEYPEEAPDEVPEGDD